MVCPGLWVSFGSQVDASQTWALLFGLVGYTLLLAVTACLLVRFIGVWDDVRTVLLLVVLMFLATSVTFDEVLPAARRGGSVAGRDDRANWMCGNHPRVGDRALSARDGHAHRGLRAQYSATGPRRRQPAILFAWLAAAFCRGYGDLRQVVAGIDYIAIGMVLFSLAVLTSMVKGGRVSGEDRRHEGQRALTTIGRGMAHFPVNSSSWRFS